MLGLFLCCCKEILLVSNGCYKIGRESGPSEEQESPIRKRVTLKENHTFDKSRIQRIFLPYRFYMRKG